MHAHSHSVPRPHQGALQGEDGGWPSLLQRLHAAAPAPTAEGVGLALFEVELPAKQ